VANITNIQLNQTSITNLRLVNGAGYSNISTPMNAIDTLIAEGGESFYNYVDWLGLSDERDLIVLSSKHHFYYDPEEINQTRTIVNIKELNKIKQLKPFIYSCLHFLSEGSNFIGCFIDNEKINGYELRNLSNSYNDKVKDDDAENGITSRFPFINMIYSLIDFKTNTYMSIKSISLLLKQFSFKVMDLTEYQGFTFFHSRKFLDYH
jgi:hypothetical protein